MGNVRSCFVTQEEIINQVITEDNKYYQGIGKVRCKQKSFYQKEAMILKSSENLKKLIKIQTFFRLKFAQFKFQKILISNFKIIESSLEPFLIKDSNTFLLTHPGEILYQKIRNKFFSQESSKELCTKHINKNISPLTIEYDLVYLNGKYETAYIGSWNIRKQFEGYGILYTKTSRLEGYWHNNHLNGFGLSFNNNEFYRGDFKDTVSKGKGELYNLAADSFYIGEINNNVPNGKGKEVFCSDNSTFEGNFVNGKKSFGKYSWPDGSVYNGEFDDDQFHGFGEYNWERSGIKYEGYWNHGVFEGKGKMWYEDGSTYEGYFKDGLRNGFGKYIWNENKYYEGEWENGKQNGKGVYIKRGVKTEGIWCKGKIVNSKIDKLLLL